MIKNYDMWKNDVPEDDDVRCKKCEESVGNNPYRDKKGNEFCSYSCAISYYAEKAEQFKCDHCGLALFVDMYEGRTGHVFCSEFCVARYYGIR